MQALGVCACAPVPNWPKHRGGGRGLGLRPRLIQRHPLCVQIDHQTQRPVLEKAWEEKEGGQRTSWEEKEGGGRTRMSWGSNQPSTRKSATEDCLRHARIFGKYR